MRTILLLLVMVQFSSLAQKVQKVDLDRFSFNVEYQELPEKYVVFEKRLYSIDLNLSPLFLKYYPNKVLLSQRIPVYGWKQTVGLSNLDISMNLNNFIEQTPKLETTTEETKGKDGVVVKRNLNSIVAEIKANSTVKIKVKGVISTSGKDEEFTIPLKLSYIYKTRNPSENQQIVKDLYEKEKAEFFVNSINKHVEDVISETNMKINNLYGFRPRGYTDKLWIIDSKDEEGAIQKEAIEATKIIFSKMTADGPIDTITNEMQPLIEYFESLKTKYKEEDKNSKKIRYSAFYNLGRIYIHLDQPEKAIIEGQGLILNGFDTKDGKKIIEDATYDLNIFKNTPFKSKHNPQLY